MSSGMPCRVGNEVGRAFRCRYILCTQRYKRKVSTRLFLSVDIQRRAWQKPRGAEEQCMLPGEVRCNFYSDVTDNSHHKERTLALYPLFRPPLELFGAAGNLTNSLDKLKGLVPFYWAVADEPMPASGDCDWSCIQGTVLLWSLRLPFLPSYKGTHEVFMGPTIGLFFLKDSFHVVQCV